MSAKKSIKYLQTLSDSCKACQMLAMCQMLAKFVRCLQNLLDTRRICQMLAEFAKYVIKDIFENYYI